MNIPESINELRQGTRSESAYPASASDRPPGQERSSRASSDAAGIKDVSGSTPQSVSRKEAEGLVSDIESKLQNTNVQLKFNVLEENDTVQVEIQDSEGKTIRKIPSDELVKLSSSLKNLDRGFLDEIS